MIDLIDRRSRGSAWLHLVAAADKIRRLVQEIAWCRKESHSNDDVKAKKHGPFEVVRFAILNGICYDQNGHGESNSFDYNIVSTPCPNIKII